MRLPLSSLSPYRCERIGREDQPMSALGGGFNRSTQHSFFLLGFESQGLATRCQTSVTLEDTFWSDLKEIARASQGA
jgi:hypothetical protein